jgi:hypothetical protein
MSFVLTIRERNDSWAGRPPARSSHRTREEAEAALLGYVRRNWDAVMGTEVLEAYDICESA